MLTRSLLLAQALALPSRATDDAAQHHAVSAHADPTPNVQRSSSPLSSFPSSFPRRSAYQRRRLRGAFRSTPRQSEARQGIESAVRVPTGASTMSTTGRCWRRSAMAATWRTVMASGECCSLLSRCWPLFDLRFPRVRKRKLVVSSASRATRRLARLASRPR